MVTHLETEKLLRRADELLMFDPGDKSVHPAYAGVGLAASGGLGKQRREQFHADYLELVRLAKLAVQAGFTSEPPRARRSLFGDSAA